MKLDVRLKKKRSCIVFKDVIAKNFVANEHHSFTFYFVFTLSVVVVDLPTDCILSFLFPAETDVLVPVLSQSIDVVVVNFVVVLKFPITSYLNELRVFWWTFIHECSLRWSSRRSCLSLSSIGVQSWTYLKLQVQILKTQFRENIHVAS